MNTPYCPNTPAPCPTSSSSNEPPRAPRGADGIRRMHGLVAVVALIVWYYGGKRLVRTPATETEREADAETVRK